METARATPAAGRASSPPSRRASGQASLYLAALRQSESDADPELAEKLCHMLLQGEEQGLKARALALLAKICNGRGRFPEALRHSKEALRLDHTLFAAHAAKVEACGGLGRWREAIRAASLCLNVMKARRNRVDTPRRGRAASLEELLGDTVDNADTPASRSILLCVRADANRRLGRLRAAVRDASAAATLCPSCAAAYAIRGEIFYQLAQWKRSAADFSIARALDRQATHGADPLSPFLPTRAMWRSR
eukprot:scaffold3250_cov222-Pinguiococcus_pyrenoidosus.AAC.6